MQERDYQDNDLTPLQKQSARVKSIYNYVLGSLIILVGVAFLIQPGSMPFYLKDYDDGMIKVFSVLCFVYGGFRLYRGYAKNYFH